MILCIKQWIFIQIEKKEKEEDIEEKDLEEKVNQDK